MTWDILIAILFGFLGGFVGRWLQDRAQRRRQLNDDLDLWQRQHRAAKQHGDSWDERGGFPPENW